MNLNEFFKSKEYQTQRSFALLILVCICVATWLLYSQNREEKSLRNARYTWGVINKMNHSTRWGRRIDLYYFNKENKRILIEEIEISADCFEDRKQGDTIVLKYAVSDNQIVKVVFCYWNDALREKYKR